MNRDEVLVCLISSKTAFYGKEKVEISEPHHPWKSDFIQINNCGDKITWTKKVNIKELSINPN
ncbi:MAG: hypothetical protein WBA93_19925 [Microcoleaceae cyanobacterium]